MEKVKIGLLGFGVVGSSVYRLLTKERLRILEGTGVDLEVTRIADMDTAKHGVDAPASLFTTDGTALVEDPGIDVVVELIGGVDAAFGLISGALENGKNVVTANKQLLANRGAALFELAREKGRQIRFEASVGGAIPIIKVMRESMFAAELHTVYGIVNGTTNYILSAMHRGEGDYAATLARAQALGYAEADPSADVGGADAAAKMAILASIAFHSRVTLQDVSFEGITSIHPEDISYARDLGFVIKLVGSARLLNDRVNVRVAPTLVPAGHPLAGINGSYNAVLLVGDAIDEIMLSGPGAGGLQTSTAVISDIVSIVSTTTTGFMQNCSCYRTLPLLPEQEMHSAFFIRVRVEDRPGVLAQLASIFGERAVSIQSLIQKGHGDQAELVLITHPSPEKDFHAALEAIAGLSSVRSRPMTIRVLE